MFNVSETVEMTSCLGKVFLQNRSLLQPDHSSCNLQVDRLMIEAGTAL